MVLIFYYILLLNCIRGSYDKDSSPNLRLCLKLAVLTKKLSLELCKTKKQIEIFFMCDYVMGHMQQSYTIAACDLLHNIIG